MDWLNLHIPTVLRSPEFIGAEPIDRSTSLMLLAFCAQLENGGTIQGCRTWKDRKWQQLAGVTLAEVNRDCELWTWEGENLVVRFYPTNKETEVKANRENGRTGGRPRRVTQRKPPGFESDKPRENHPVSDGIHPEETMRHEIAETEGEGEGEREGERKGNTQREALMRVSDIVSLYPRNAKRAEAIDVLARMLANGQIDLDAVEAGTRAIAAIIPQLPSGHLNRYVPDALSFFKGRRWEDDPKTWLRGTAAANGELYEMQPKREGGRSATIIKL